MAITGTIPPKEQINHVELKDMPDTEGTESSHDARYIRKALATFLALTDTPSDYSGEAGKAAVVKATEDGLEFATPSAADFPMKQKPNLTRRVIPGWLGSALTNTEITADRIYYTPIFVSETTTYIRIGVEVNSGAMATADLRIFNWSNGVPGSLVLSAGTVSVLFVGIAEITISQQLTRGYYYLAMRCAGTPTLRGIAGIQLQTAPVPGFTTGSTILPHDIILYADAAFADPAPAPTGSLRSWYGFVFLREN